MDPLAAFLLFLFLVVNPACWYVVLVLVPRWMQEPSKLKPITKENPDGI